MNKESEIKVSVVIPVYNAEKYLTRCLNSILAQTHKNLEIICVNDGSSDNSAAILNEYATHDQRIKIITKENGGLASARNAGMDIATGYYIGFIDSDDWVDDNYYSVLVQCALANNSDFAIVPTRLYASDGRQFILRPHSTFNFSWFSYKVDAFRGGAVWDKIYRLDLLNRHNIRFDDGHNWEGNLFLLKVAFHSKFFTSTIDSFYHYISTPNSITNAECPESVRKNIMDRLFACRAISRWTKHKKLRGKDFRAVMKLVERSVVDGGFYKSHRLSVWRALGLSMSVKWCLGRLVRKPFNRQY